jgi:myotubularin-related protein 1/2
MIPCTLFMTDYRIVLIPSLQDLARIATRNPSVHSWLHVSLACIDRIERGRKARDAKDAAYVCINIRIVCKDLREYQLAVREREVEVDKALTVMTTYAFPNNLKHMFAFSHTLPPWGDYNRVTPYDTHTEFTRQGVLEMRNPALRELLGTGLGMGGGGGGGGGEFDGCPWRLSSVNENFGLCSTYPRLLIAPANCTDRDLQSVSMFRSGQRLPTLCWGDRETGATMWRCSQPKAGVSGSCQFDEKFLDFIAKSCVGMQPPAPPPCRRGPGYPLLFIVDCRPRASALANRAAGAGYETQTNYPNTRLEFYNIGNIHVMRDSLRSMTQLLLQSNAANAGADLGFGRALEDTGWPSHIRHVIKAAYDTAEYIRKGVPVLVHCSHGWDRTAQVCSLAQLLLDPYYRTMEGFAMLVEKEWNSFGHQFGMRCAHGLDRGTRKEDEMSPIFLQFLDATWQLHRQQPHYFEFNSKYVFCSILLPFFSGL